MDELQRCSGYKGHWVCGEDYPDHMVPVGKFSFHKGRCVNVALTISLSDQSIQLPEKQSTIGSIESPTHLVALEVQKNGSHTWTKQKLYGVQRLKVPY